MEPTRPGLRRACLIGLSLAVLFAAAPARADIDIRGGAYTDLEKPFVGLGFLSHVSSRLYINPNVEYVFVDNGTFGTGNFDALLHLPTGGSPTLWVGGGLALAYTDSDTGGSETKARANLLAGIGFGGRSSPYIQAKYITGYGYWVLAAGFRF